LLAEVVVLVVLQVLEWVVVLVLVDIDHQFLENHLVVVLVVNLLY
jgi:hypothetical protein